MEKYGRKIVKNKRSRFERVTSDSGRSLLKEMVKNYFLKLLTLEKRFLTKHD